MADIRAAAAADFEGIVQLMPDRDELFYIYPRGTYPFSISQLEQLAKERLALTVAVDKAQVVGFANLYDLEPGKHVFIGNVVVDRAWRGRGIGRSLVEHMIKVARDEYSMPRVRISVFNENTPALLLYLGAGFSPYAAEQRTDPTGRSVVLLHMSNDL